MQMHRFNSLWQSLLLSIGLSWVSKTASAQVVPDDTLNTQVNSNGNVSEITGGQTRGDNLFHSFRDFSVQTGNEAFFNNAAEISNIFSRVTGGNISNIDGLIRANGSANLFLLNPNGIIFGENASLDIGGSFLSSTADSIVFAAGEFGAIDPGSLPLLAINAPIGVNLGANPGSIVNRSTVQEGEANLVGLKVLEGNDLNLIGGKIEFEGGSVTAEGGNVELGGLSTAGTVSISEDGSLAFPENIDKADVILSNGAVANVRGTGGGNIDVNARNFLIDDDGSLEAGIAAESTSIDAQAGDIAIALTGNLALNAGVISNIVEAQGKGNTGDVNVTASSMEATNRGFISAGTRGQGDGGNINIDTTGDIILDDLTGDAFISNISSRVEPEGMGDAGDITINTNNLILTGGGIDVITSGAGNAGKIEITATENISIDSKGFSNGILSLVRPLGVGNAGSVNVSTSSMTLANGGQISANTEGKGNAGNVEITAKDITLEGLGSDGLGSTIFSDTEGKGNAGNVDITATNIMVKGLGNRVSSQVSSEAVGDGGNIRIDTNNLTLKDGGFIDASTFGRGNTGNVDITATDISIDGENFNGSTFIGSRVEEGAVGNAREVKIFTENLTITNGGFLDASTFGQGNAGSINVGAKNITFDGTNLRGTPSSIFSQVNPNGAGNAGGVKIDTDNLNLTNKGRISAITFGQGNAGNIRIDTNNLDLTGGGTVSTSTSGQGNAGNIEIAATNINVEGLGSEVSSAVREDAVGNAGNINLKADRLSLSDRASINAVTRSQISNNNSTANIALQIAEGITLQNNSFISAQALGNANGGNVTINTEDGYVLAFQKQNNDIVANAEQGQGGKIMINARSIFGIEERVLNDSTNDINASSEFNSPGTVEIKVLETDPSQDSLNISVAVVETEVIQTCDRNSDESQSELVVTGRGGLPDSPKANLDGNFVLEDWRVENSHRASSDVRSPKNLSIKDTERTKPIVEANSWSINQQGKVVLVAANQTSKSSNPIQSTASCPAN